MWQITLYMEAGSDRIQSDLTNHSEWFDKSLWIRMLWVSWHVTLWHVTLNTEAVSELTNHSGKEALSDFRHHNNTQINLNKEIGRALSSTSNQSSKPYQMAQHTLLQYVLQCVVPCVLQCVFLKPVKRTQSLGTAPTTKERMPMRVCVCVRMCVCVCVCVCVCATWRMGHATRMNETRHAYEWVTSRIWMSHVTHRNESRHTYEWVTSRIWMSHVTHMNESRHTMNESRHTYEWALSHIWMSHVTRMNESRHTCEWGMSRIWMCHSIQVDGSCHACKWVTSHTAFRTRTCAVTYP